MTRPVSAATLAKARELAIRPQAVLLLAGLDVAGALFWAFATAIGAFTARPELSADQTNYIGHAVGAVNVALTAGFMIPAGLALLVLAWGTVTQRSWAWTGNAALLAASILWSVIRFGSSPIWSLMKLGVCAASAWLWMQPKVKSWYGTG